MNLSLKLLGHACFLINIEEKVVIIDPQKSDYSGKTDLILVSHSHRDHFDVSETEKLLKKGTIIIAPEDCKSEITTPIKSLKPGQEASFGKVKVRAVEAHNVKRFRSPGVPFHPKGLGVGYLISGEGRTIYHAGDTDFIPEMKQLGHVDVALLPSGGTYTMDSPDAAEAALVIKPGVVIPMHRWDTDPEEFRKRVESVDSRIKVVILAKGEEYQVV
jgi:L-ascorbate metabolism protein UlaG (beta-lactamase superfamily)